MEPRSGGLMASTRPTDFAVLLSVAIAIRAPFTSDFLAEPHRRDPIRVAYTSNQGPLTQ